MMPRKTAFTPEKKNRETMMVMMPRPATLPARIISVTWNKPNRKLAPAMMKPMIMMSRSGSREKEKVMS